MNFYENYVYLCNKLGKTPSAVALEIGLSKPAVHRWKSGGVPTDATARKVALYFGVSVEYMRQSLAYNLQETGVKVEETKKPADQKADGLRGTGYYDLTPENQKVIDSLIETLLNSQSRG